MADLINGRWVLKDSYDARTEKEKRVRNLGRAVEEAGIVLAEEVFRKVDEQLVPVIQKLITDVPRLWTIKQLEILHGSDVAALQFLHNSLKLSPEVVVIDDDMKEFVLRLMPDYPPDKIVDHFQIMFPEKEEGVLDDALKDEEEAAAEKEKQEANPPTPPTPSETSTSDRSLDPQRSGDVDHDSDQSFYDEYYPK